MAHAKSAKFVNGMESAELWLKSREEWSVRCPETQPTTAKRKLLLKLLKPNNDPWKKLNKQKFVLILFNRTTSTLDPHRI